MALPVILIDSATGSDTTASGAGPATALSGNNAVSAADGLSVVLTTDNPDLSGVATDGSAVLFFNDATAGNKNHVKITNVNNTTKVVTVANALGLSLTKAWAIGGKRASIGGTTSVKLFTNNGAAGDAQPGWVVEFQSAHAETIAAALQLRGNGDVTTGPIILRGKSGAATLPVITFSNNGIAIQGIANFIHVRDFQLLNSNATKTASVGIQLGAGTNIVARGLKIGTSGNKFWKAATITTASNIIRDCELAYSASFNLDVSVNHGVVMNNWIHDGAVDGVNLNSGATGLKFIGNVVYGNGGDGLEIASTANSNATPMGLILGNIFASNTGDGVKISSSSAQISGYVLGLIANNDFSNNGGWGLNFSGASVTDILLWAQGLQVLGNNHYNNTSSTTQLSSLAATLTAEENTKNVNPAYTNAAAGNFTSTALKEFGYPLGGTLAVGTYSTTYSYPDIGVQAHTAASGGLVRGNMSGGML